MKKIIYLILILTSCTKSIPLELNEIEQQLVVNALISPENNIEVFINTTFSILDTNISNINPRVQLFENNTLVADLQQNINEIYQIDYTLSSSKQYRIEVTDSFFGSCIAIDTIPEKVLIDDATFFLPAGFDDYGYPYYETTIKFADPKNIPNYYEIIIFNGSSSSVPDSYITELVTSNESIINEGNQDYLPNSLFFSDILFDGSTFELKIKFLSGYQMLGENIYVPDSDYYIILRSISYTYYLYRKYWTRHSHNQTVSNDLLGMLFNGEPVDAYTNIENGYGIFAGYNEDIKKITFINK